MWATESKINKWGRDYRLLVMADLNIDIELLWVADEGRQFQIAQVLGTNE